MKAERLRIETFARLVTLRCINTVVTGDLEPTQKASATRPRRELRWHRKNASMTLLRTGSMERFLCYGHLCLWYGSGAAQVNGYLFR